MNSPTGRQAVPHEPGTGGPPKGRLLHAELAALVADLRHGDTVCVGDAGAGTHSKTLIPLDPGVRRIDLGIATGVPLVTDVVDALVRAGDFRAAVVGNFTVEYNQPMHAFLVDHFGEARVTEVQHFPEWYKLRDRARAHIQTGDHSVAANVILVAGPPGPDRHAAGPDRAPGA
ncbi:RbsD/FucU domain-containing protein [Streptomyces phaeolivaceus]|uniref:RbsD/FucU domain-containing protein n=1 Tax=Streptomyces phaeolivaceus TaxID=2653200 RepID=UPI00186A9FD7|nr:RbsD/FucU domain-containing protein [Streptomyces phaeolivaceus]